jgi:hypothetical protein
MKKIIFSLLVILFGCSDSADQAGANLKKGDEFFNKSEYEVAEYYYEKVPEESPLFRQAQTKLEAIAGIKERWKVIPGDTVEISNIILVENKYNTDNTSRLPIHAITLANRSWKKLKSINIEFTYYNAAGAVITKLIVEIETDLDSRNQKVYENVSPGVIQERFAKCDARIINAVF